MSTPKQATLMDHVVELRWRLCKIAAVFFVGAIFGYVVRGPIITLLQKPLGEKLYFTSPTGSFEFIMQVCALVGIVLALPVVIYQLLRFIEPALAKPLRRRLIVIVVVSSYLLAAAGVTLAYMAGLPAALHFFTSVGTSQLHPLITINEYFRFLMSYLITFAVAFQLPLLLLLINHVTPLGPTKLRSWRKYVIVGSFGIALLTPSAPDPMTQLILALPIIALYEISLWLVVVMQHRSANPKGGQLAHPAPKVQPAEPVVAQAAAALVAPRPAPRPRPMAPPPAAPRRRPAAASATGGPAIDLRQWAPPPPQLSYHTIDLRPRT